MSCRGGLFMRSLDGYFSVYFPRSIGTLEIKNKIRLSWMHKKFATTVCILFYLWFVGFLVQITEGLLYNPLYSHVRLFLPMK